MNIPHGLQELQALFLLTLTIQLTHPLSSMGFIRKLSFVAIAAVGRLLTLTQAQFVRPPTDLITKAGAAGIGVRYKSVPVGTCETRANMNHYSGYIDVGKDEHIHFQFFETRKGDPRQAPLSV